MGLGLQGAYGIRGGYDALEEIIARRKKDEIVAQLQANKEREFRIQEAQQRESEQWRKLQFEGLQHERERQDEDRDSARADRKTALDMAEQDRKAGIIKTRLETLQPGSKGSGLDAAQAHSVGLGELYTPDKIDPNNLDAPQTFTKGATYSQQKDASAAEAAKKAAQDSAELRLMIARMGQNKQSPYYTPVVSTASPLGMVLIDAHSGQVKLPDMPAGYEQGLLGPMAKDAAKNAAPIAAFINSLDALETVGEKLDWQGLGPAQGLQGQMARWGLTTPPPGMIEMQSAVTDVQSFIGNKRYGSALTETEKQTLKQFVADSYVPGKITREMVRSVKDIEMDVLKRTEAGPFGPLNRQGQPALPGPSTTSAPDPYGALDLFKHP
jgi:hypothetical protein